jgi:hypothetical protein
VPSVRTPFLILCASGILAAQGNVPLVEHIASRLRPNDLKADVSFLASDALREFSAELRGAVQMGESAAADGPWAISPRNR